MSTRSIRLSRLAGRLNRPEVADGWHRQREVVRRQCAEEAEQRLVRGAACAANFDGFQTDEDTVAGADAARRPPPDGGRVHRLAPPAAPAAGRRPRQTNEVSRSMIDGHCNTPRDRDRLIAILVRSSLPKRALPMQIAQNVDQRQTRSRLAVPRQSRSFHAGKVKPVTTTAAAPIRLRAVRLDRPRRGDSTGRHGGVAFAAECVAVQFAVTVPIVADSRVHGSHEGDPDREVYSPMQPYDCASLSPDQRAQQIAALLATGLRRLLVRSALPACPKNLPDLSPNGLELPREIRLSGHAG